MSEPIEPGPSPLDGTNAHEIIASICSDFRLLVIRLGQQIEQVEDPDSEILVSLWNARVAAERGLCLSELLAGTIADKNGQ